MVQRHRTAPVFRPRLPSLTLLAALLATLLTSGCVYRMTVQQGNFLDARQVVQVKEGMTRAQIRFLLGTPMLPDAFDRDRWDYLYYLQVGRQKEAEEQRLTIYFTDDKVSRIENVGAPTEIPAEQASTPASTPDSNDAQP
ncbi:MAG: outer membrane protein assembly factor BamE [Steroidobacteraceae bacterium]